MLALPHEEKKEKAGRELRSSYSLVGETLQRPEPLRPFCLWSISTREAEPRRMQARGLFLLLVFILLAVFSEAGKNKKDKVKKNGSDCEEWRWGPCIPNSKDCGVGFREGTCQEETKKLKCKIPCNWKKEFGADCKYKFENWGGCDPATGLKARSGTLKKALYNAECQETIQVTKPCSPKTKSKSKVSFALVCFPEMQHNAPKETLSRNERGCERNYSRNGMRNHIYLTSLKEALCINRKMQASLVSLCTRFPTEEVPTSWHANTLPFPIYNAHMFLDRQPSHLRSSRAD
ncbi:hypothetical protein E2320_021106 [Naja naja]|nr:hypothetical protein E2320_021106 [Naja naja]